MKKGVESYLYQRNAKEIYIEMTNRGGCCSGPVYLPVVKLGKPDCENMYDLIMKDNIACYLPRKAINNETKQVTIKLHNILGRKSLAVTGILAYKEDTWARSQKKY
ncbi:CC/Se motif family (seleno)protein [Acetobacterium paludosum]|nr:CC/Se motif family (seleno)protein [Acetobacterium paludosum]